MTTMTQGLGTPAPGNDGVVLDLAPSSASGSSDWFPKEMARLGIVDQYGVGRLLSGLDSKEEVWTGMTLNWWSSRYSSLELEKAFMIDLFSRMWPSQLAIICVTLAINIYCLVQFSVRSESKSTAEAITFSILFGIAIALALAAIIFMLLALNLIDTMLKDESVGGTCNPRHSVQHPMAAGESPRASRSDRGTPTIQRAAQNNAHTHKSKHTSAHVSNGQSGTCDATGNHTAQTSVSVPPVPSVHNVPEPEHVTLPVQAPQETASARSMLELNARELFNRQTYWVEATGWTSWWLTHAWDFHMMAMLTMFAVAFNGSYIARCSSTVPDPLCASYRNGQWPLPPALAVVAATISPVPIMSNLIAGLGGIIVAYSVLIVQMSLFYAGIDGKSERVWDTVLMALLLAVVCICTSAVMFFLSRTRRRSFSLIVSLRNRFFIYRAAVQKWRSSAERIQVAQNAELRAEASRAVAEATIGYAAHQLRNPLHALRSLIDDIAQREIELCLARGVAQDPENVSDLEDMQTAVSHMTRITEDAMAHQQLLTAKVHVHIERVCVRRLITRLAGHLAKRHNRSVVITISDTVSEYLMFDALRVTQAVANGLANALEATPAEVEGGWVEVLVYVVMAEQPDLQPGNGGISVVVDKPGIPVHTLELAGHDVRASATGVVVQPQLPSSAPQLAPFLHIEVINTGPGLGKLTKEHLFMPFIAGHAPGSGTDPASPSRVRSIGLGLSIVRLLAELMKSRVSLYDEPNPVLSGNPAAPCITHFFLEMPIRLPTEAETLEAESASRSQKGQRESFAGPNSAPLLRRFSTRRPPLVIPVIPGQHVTPATAEATAYEGQLSSLGSRGEPVQGVVSLHARMPESAGLASKTWKTLPLPTQFGVPNSDDIFCRESRRDVPMYPPPEFPAMITRAGQQGMLTPISGVEVPHSPSSARPRLRGSPRHATMSPLAAIVEAAAAQHTGAGGPWIVNNETTTHLAAPAHPHPPVAFDTPSSTQAPHRDSIATLMQNVDQLAPDLGSTSAPAPPLEQYALQAAQFSVGVANASRVLPVGISDDPAVLPDEIVGGTTASALPQSQEQKPVMPLSQVMAMIPAPVAAAPPLRYAGLRVLTADDEKSNRKINERLLHKLGAEVVSVDDGDGIVPAVLAAVEEMRPFDVIMLDMIMKRMSGLEALHGAKRAGYTGKVLAATGNATPMDQARYLAAGFDAVLAKPFTASDIAAAFSALGICAPFGPSRAPPTTADEGV